MAATVKPLLRSFAGGEITPELYGRLDLDKFQTGLAKALNFHVLPHGPAQNRAGFQYVLEAKTSAKRTRVIPFAYSASQTMLLEFGDQYVRFHTEGATLLESTKSITAITQASPGVITSAAHGYANGDWVYVSGCGGMTSLNSRFFIVASATANSYTLTDLAGAAIDTSALAAYSGGGTTARVYTVATPFLEADLFDLHYTQSADVLTITHPSYAPRELRRLSVASWTLSSASFAPVVAAPAAPTVGIGGPGGGTATTHTYKTTAVSADTYEESLPSPAVTSGAIDLAVSGNHVDVTPATVVGAVRYNVYKLANGGLYGYIGQSDGTLFSDTNITPDLSQTPPEASTPFTGSGNYPSTVTYMEQRRCFAATDNKPQNVWMTRSATEGNLSQSVPVRDNDAIIFRIAATQQNRIRHLVPLNDLIALTAGGEFRIFAAGSDVLTPSSVSPKIQSSVGASNVQPAVAETSILYAQAQGGHVREFTYSGEGINGALYRTNDVSILAPHLFDGYTVVDIAYSRTAANPTLWVVRSDGVLLGMTYVPGQNVRAWHQHSTDGLFESVACVSEGAEDVLYAVVGRTINGRAVRYVERLHTRRFTDQADAFFVDSGSTYDGAPATVISGLWHLEGETVSVLADGAVLRGLTVSGGGITLPQAASVVHVGLPITASLRTLPVSWQADGFGQGVVKNVNKVHLRLSASSGVHVGPADGRLVEVKQRTNEPYGSPPALFTGWKHVNVTPLWQDDGGIEIEQTDPLPVTVLAMVLDVVPGG
jgi:hypothetical protein